MQNEILVIAGGTWHDFEGFISWVEPKLRADGFTACCTTDPNQLLSLKTGQTRGVIIYTSLGGSIDNVGRTGTDFTSAQVSALRDWARAGGAILALHGATVSSESNTAYQTLVGGRFITHPEALTFTVYPMAQTHPTIQGIDAFDIKDELYIQTIGNDVAIHMATIHQGICHPMVWSRSEGKGRVVHLAPGHFPEVWKHPSYERLFTQSLAWACDVPR